MNLIRKLSHLLRLRRNKLTDETLVKIGFALWAASGFKKLPSKSDVEFFLK